MAESIPSLQELCLTELLWRFRREEIAAELATPWTPPPTESSDSEWLPDSYSDNGKDDQWSD